MNEQRKELIEALAGSFFKIGRSVNQQLFQSKNSHSLTPPQFYILFVLKKQGRMTVSQLGQLLELTSGATTTATNRLEEVGYILRTRDLEDRRVVWLEITREGIVMIESSLDKRNEIWGEFLDELDLSELKSLQSLLGKVKKEL
ncbi:MarR family winged helix-turn-helix transcriptional regulator [Metabacillus herbersteinensis]|uniref:MarR family winged helix-turn-helix transcriptional regulator n=1 Tax=Metabacillus herbersteinensis TaxID=283816 RepID=A0ABV6GEY7_9BACI